MMPCPMAEYPDAPRLHECLSLDRGATLKSQNGLSLSDAGPPRIFARATGQRNGTLEWAEDQVAELEEGWKLRRPATRLQLKSRQTSECLTRTRMYATALLDRAGGDVFSTVESCVEMLIGVALRQPREALSIRAAGRWRDGWRRRDDW